MISEGPVQKVVNVLTACGYKEKPSPILVSSVPFEFAATLLGSDRSNDLIVVVDTLMEKSPRIRQKIEGLARALDLASSRRPLTVVLVGPSLLPGTADALSRVSRVLAVGTPIGEPGLTEIHDALAVLMPLIIPNTSEIAADPLEEVRRKFGAVTPDVSAWIDASRGGVEAVRDALRASVVSAIKVSEEKE